jgi:hypothetical protein
VRVEVDGRAVARLSRLEVVYALVPLVWNELRLARVELTGLRLRAVRAADGWRLPGAAGAGGEREGERGGGESRFVVSIARLAIEDGRIAVALLDAEPPRRFAATDVTLAGSASFGAGRTTARLETLRFVPRGIALSPVTASGALAAEREAVRVSRLAVATARTRLGLDGAVRGGRFVAARARLAPLAAADVRAVLPSLGVATDVRAALRVHGPWHALAASARADLGAAGKLGARE